MKKGNLKPSLLTYYLTRYSLVHPMLAITQINIAIYLITASPFINKNLLTSAAVAFRQFFSLLMLSIMMCCTRKCSHKITCRDIKFLFALGFVGIFLVQYFQLKVIQAITGGLYQVGIWQLLIPAGVTVVSMLLGYERASKVRYIAVGVSGLFLIISIILILTVYPFSDEIILLYCVIFLISSALNFILMKKFVMKTKMNLLAVVFWIYFIGTSFTTLLFISECTIFDTATLRNMVEVMYSKEEIVGILIFSCMNDALNIVNLLYLMKKAFISKSSVYGILNAIFIIGQGVVSGVFNVVEYLQIIFFTFGYVSIFFERRRENHIRKKKTEKQLVKYLMEQDEDQVSQVYMGKNIIINDEHYFQKEKEDSKPQTSFDIEQGSNSLQSLNDSEYIGIEKRKIRSFTENDI